MTVHSLNRLDRLREFVDIHWDVFSFFPALFAVVLSLAVAIQVTVVR